MPGLNENDFLKGVWEVRGGKTEIFGSHNILIVSRNGFFFKLTEGDQKSFEMHRKKKL
jgi:hypothetical protein